MEENGEHPVVTQNLSHNECDAMRVLFIGEWPISRLKMSFQYGSDRAIKYHLYNECSHNNKFELNKEDYKKIKLRDMARLKGISTNFMDTFECNAVRLLKDDWTTKELQMVFETNSAYIHQHKTGSCSHDKLEPVQKGTRPHSPTEI